MDVSLVLTHRCNLACPYCYAGSGSSRDMTPETVERALELLFSQAGSDPVLSFFGGEPFLAFDEMQRVTTLAQARADREGRALRLQCTTNGTRLQQRQIDFIRETGMFIALSIDGVREAHEANRPRTGGGSSFDRVVKALRALVLAGTDPDVMMVVTPGTVPFVFQSVRWLWSQGVRIVRANLDLSARWSAEDRLVLRQELVAVGREQLKRRLAGRSVVFQPFEVGMRSQDSTAGCTGAHLESRRAQVVVATSGHLYPCAPMVGQDRDDGPEAALRIGHVTDDLQLIAARIASKGAGCGDGTGCACAAYLETGDRTEGGPIGLWYARVCAEIGRVIASSLDCHEVRQALAAGDERGGRAARSPREAGGGRRTFLRLGLAAAGVAGGGALVWNNFLSSGWNRAGEGAQPHHALPGALAIPVEPEPVPVPAPKPEPPPRPAPEIAKPGEVSAPPPKKTSAPPKRTGIEIGVDGDMDAPPEKPPPRRVDEVRMLGDVATPLPPKRPPRPMVRGSMARPVEGVRPKK
jgi:uncharacterized protein